MRGAPALRSYLDDAKVPCETRQRFLQGASLTWCLPRGKVDAVITMLQAGFDANLLVSTDHSRYRAFKQASAYGFLESVFMDSCLQLPSMELASIILKEHQGTEIEDALVRACLRSQHEDVPQFLFQNTLGPVEASSIVMMALVARLNNKKAVSLLHEEFGIEYPANTMIWGRGCSVLLLSAATLDRTSSMPRLLAKSKPASLKLLKFLVNKGIGVNTCHPSMWSPQYRVAGEQLK